MQLWSSYTTRDKEINLHQPKKELVLWLRTVKCILYLQVNVFYQNHYTKNFFCTGKAAIRLHYSSHLAAGIWGATEMLASSDPGMDLAGATEHCSSSISFRMGGGGLHTQHKLLLMDWHRASQPLHHSPRENCEDVRQKACSHVHTVKRNPIFRKKRRG